MRIILSPAMLWRVVDACRHVLIARRVLRHYTGELVGVVVECAAVKTAQVGDALTWAAKGAEWVTIDLQRFVETGQGFNLRPLDGV